MQRIWKYISNLGIAVNNGLANKSNVLSNQINFILFTIMLLLFVTTFITLQEMH